MSTTLQRHDAKLNKKDRSIDSRQSRADNREMVKLGTYPSHVLVEELHLLMHS